MSEFSGQELEDFKLQVDQQKTPTEEEEQEEVEEPLPLEEKEEEEVEELVESKTPSEVVSETYDDSELTEREKQLIARLEQVTEENLERTKPNASLEINVPKPGEEDFVGEIDLDEALSSKENFNRLLQSVYEKALTEGAKRSAESIMASLPRTMTEYVNKHLEMRDIVNKFYEENSDLSSVKRTVAAVANEISANNPEMSVDEVFKRTAVQTRTMLRLRNPQQNTTNKQRVNNNSQNARPAFTGQKGRLKVPELTGLAKEISELVDF